MAHELAVKAASEKEKKAAVELKRLQDKEQESARKVADLERQQQQQPVSTGPADDTIVVGPLKPGAVPGGPVRPNQQAAASPGGRWSPAGPTRPADHSRRRKNSLPRPG